MIKIYIASDHAGVELKSEIVKKLLNMKWLPHVAREVFDLGPQSSESVDYPDYANLVCQKIRGISVVEPQGQAPYPFDIGILICGSGQGMAMRANKFQHIRAALCYSKEIAQLSREHNNANALCLGARFLSFPEVEGIMEIFLTTSFVGGRHLNRVNKICQAT